MNVFIGVGIIEDVQKKGRVLNFNFCLQQDMPCAIPCVVFNPNDEIEEFVERIQTSRRAVWLQGRIYCNDYEYNNKTVRKII